MIASELYHLHVNIVGNVRRRGVDNSRNSVSGDSSGRSGIERVFVAGQMVWAIR